MIFTFFLGESVELGVEDDASSLATYIIIDSRDKLDITLSPMAMNVIMKVIHVSSYVVRPFSTLRNS